MISLAPRLPTELLDSIISHSLGTTCIFEEPALLSSYALVGRLWRERINAQRFRSVRIFMSGHTTAELQLLADICTTDIWARHEGVARHVQALSLYRGSTRNSGTRLDRSSARDAAIAVVLRSLFRHNPWRARGVRAAFTLEAGNFKTGRTSGFDFATLGPAIIAAMDDLFRTAAVYRIGLTDVWGVPWSFISSANPSDLRLDTVTFHPRSGEGVGLLVPGKHLLPNLDHVSLRESPSFATGITSPVCLPPPPVTSLEIVYDIGDHNKKTYDVLYHLGGKLESLNIRIHISFFDLCPPIDYSKIHVRDNLSMEMEYSIHHGGEEEDDPPQMAAFETMVRLLPPTPPHEMYIVFVVYMLQFDTPDSERACFEDVYSKVYHRSFPEYLERITSEAHITSIDIKLCVTVQVDPGVTYISPERYIEHEDYLLEQFACMDRLRGVTFEVEVDEHEDLPNFRI
ncbi:hypothetical protein HYPSUDRAFT_219487 [Hypholoma sublateritium FD-334 SS-4]|uniref:F-box domain-containing protein n=1 Tax=Hypholoma sublateritium (strain FD-334 SS-4) TaxID=945553 RepID=A0A0D2NIC4_HYPSF|nr:hypothetical protein HYPSUDRAFT_219487 [Hypholoma sublateritium FD-334 SS-4]